MKKLLISLVLILSFGALLAQPNCIELDKKQKELSEKDFRTYFNENQLGFILEENPNFIYCVSYETENNEKAYLYFKEKGSTNWEKADYMPIFKKGEVFDNNRWTSKIMPGTSAVEIIKTEIGTCIVMLIGVKYMGITYTEVFLFYPLYDKNVSPVYVGDGTLMFEHFNRPYKVENKLQRFPYTQRMAISNNRYFFGNDSNSRIIELGGVWYAVDVNEIRPRPIINFHSKL